MSALITAGTTRTPGTPGTPGLGPDSGDTCHGE